MAVNSGHGEATDNSVGETNSSILCDIVAR